MRSLKFGNVAGAMVVKISHQGWRAPAYKVSTEHNVERTRIENQCIELLTKMRFDVPDFHVFICSMAHLTGNLTDATSYPLYDTSLERLVDFLVSSSRSLQYGRVRVRSSYISLPNRSFSTYFLEQCEHPFLEEIVDYVVDVQRSSVVCLEAPGISYAYNVPPHCKKDVVLSYVTEETLSVPRRPEHPSFITKLSPKRLLIDPERLRRLCIRIMDLYRGRRAFP
jgi:hypothetical protein